MESLSPCGIKSVCCRTEKYGAEVAVVEKVRGGPAEKAEEESGELSPLHLIVLFGTASMGMGSDNPNEEGHGFHFHAAGIHRRCLKKM